MLLSTHSSNFLQNVLFNWNKLWCVITQLSHNRPRHRYFSSFSKYFLKHKCHNTLMWIIFFLRKNQQATHGMLQKELITGSTNSATQNGKCKIVIKVTLSNLKKIWSNTNLFDKVQRRFSNYFRSPLPFLQGPFTSRVNNIRVFFTLHFLYCSNLHYYTKFNKTLWNYGGSQPWEKPRISNWKTELWQMFPVKPRAIDTMHSFYDLPSWCCE